MYDTRSTTNKRLLTALCVVAVLAVAGTAYFAKKYYNLQENPNAASEQETKRLTEAVAKLYQLPDGETPIVGKVEDKDKLKDQPFFANAQNGDDILIYQKAKVALIYRAEENKLINVGPIALDATPQTVQVSLLSGTDKQGAADAVRSSIGSISGLTINPAVKDAKNKNVPQTIVVDAKGNKNDLARQIADKIGGKVAALPAGEDSGDSDIVIIVGG